MKLFEYAILYNPKSETEKAKIVVGITTVLASDEKSATLLAARAIPEEYLDRMDQLEVAVRPF